MKKIIRLDEVRKRSSSPGPVVEKCQHKEVIVYSRTRVVCCSFCGTELDPFDVLVDLVQTSPGSDKGKEMKKYIREVKRREKDE